MATQKNRRRVGIGLQRRRLKGKSRKNTRTRLQRKSKWGILDKKLGVAHAQKKMKAKPAVASVEIIWPDLTPMLLLISAIQSVAFQPKAGRHDDMVLITLLGAEKPMKWEGPRAEELYCRIKKILAPEVLQF